MSVHIYQALREKLADVMEEGSANAWDLFESRMRGKPVNDMYGLVLPSQGWDTPKLHSKVSEWAFIQLCERDPRLIIGGL